MKKSTVIIAIIILTLATYTVIDNIEQSSFIYLTTISAVAMYGAFKKEINITHISLIFLFIYSMERLTINIVYPQLKEIGMHDFTLANIHFSFQIFCAFLSVILFLFRVQVSKIFSNSKSISLTLFDGVIPWIYIYLALVAILATIEYTLNYKFNFTYLSFIYDYYEELNYIAMSAIIGILISMVICHEKDLKRQSTNVE